MAFTQISDDQDIQTLRAYRLPDTVLPFAPDRQLFSRYSAATLQAATQLSLTRPEKRGILSRAVRSIKGIDTDETPSDGMTMEAHIDGRNISASTSELLVALGFEPDGFVQFVPSAFTDHFTLKYKIPANFYALSRERLSEVRTQCERAYALLNEDDGCESYIELEVYSGSNRRCWTPDQKSEGNGQWLPAIGQLTLLDLPRCEAEAIVLAVPLTLSKRADLHIKLQSDSVARSTKAMLLRHLCNLGFYHVVTWAGNDVCTAQFMRSRDALAMFQRLEILLDDCRAASEMTLEFVCGFWRTASDGISGPKLAQLPPLVVAVSDN